MYRLVIMSEQRRSSEIDLYALGEDIFVVEVQDVWDNKKNRSSRPDYMMFAASDGFKAG